jgi:hypothetical protein
VIQFLTSWRNFHFGFISKRHNNQTHFSITLDEIDIFPILRQQFTTEPPVIKHIAQNLTYYLNRFETQHTLSHF